MMSTATWNYRTGVRLDESEMIGYEVEAKDGNIGKIVEESLEVDAAHLVIDTGFWIFGTKRLVPAGVVSRIDYDDETVYIEITKDQVKASPEYEPRDEFSQFEGDDDPYRRPYLDYYAGFPW